MDQAHSKLVVFALGFGWKFAVNYLVLSLDLLPRHDDASLDWLYCESDG